MVHFAMPPPVLQLFDGIAFPATTDELIAFAEARGASPDVLATLQGMPSHTFGNLDDLVLRWGFVQEFALAEAPAGTMPPMGPVPAADAPAVTDEAA